MKSYKEICDYLISQSIIDDEVYDVLKNNNVGMKIYQLIKKIINNNGNLVMNDECNMVIERILLPRISIIKAKIEKLIVESGYDVSKINLLGDKVEYISSKIIDNDKINRINTLYQEFIVIRNGIWNYYLYRLNDILDKYTDDIKYDDIYQEAGLALMMAIEKFDKGNYSFKKFVTNYIKYNISYHYHDLDLYLKMPVNKRHLYYKLHKTIEFYVDKYHKMPTSEELKRMIRITSKTLSTFLALSKIDFIALDDCTYQEEVYISNEEILSNGDIRLIEDKAIGESLVNAFDEIFLELTDRERLVIDNYYLAGNNLDYRVITEKLGVSYGTTMNLRKRALTKLRKHKDELGKYLR